MYSFPKKPDNGGSPANENKKIAKLIDKKEFFFNNPEKFLISSKKKPFFLFLSESKQIKTPKRLNKYINKYH